MLLLLELVLLLLFISSSSSSSSSIYSSKIVVSVRPITTQELQVVKNKTKKTWPGLHSLPGSEKAIIIHVLDLWIIFDREKIHTKRSNVA